MTSEPRSKAPAGGPKNKEQRSISESTRTRFECEQVNVPSLTKASIEAGLGNGRLSLATTANTNDPRTPWGFWSFILPPTPDSGHDHH
ncbi:amino acid transporter [Aspergillus luchuensis]|uniref:Amino acid transporter n=1 Tax=Aspergillus kawachii TaxID=1069201 RepID=A0A146FLZ9_ASPKA|nr:amino acid transporter [Aspergillus luchuensis]